MKISLTTLLFNQIRSDVKDDLEALFLYGAVGTDNTTPTAADTTLGGEVFRSDVDEVDKSGASTAVFSLRIAASEANGNDLKETGWLDAASSGNLWLRSLVNTITKTSDIQVFLDSTITVVVTET